MSKALKVLAAGLGAVWLTACSTAGGDTAANDPYEATNRQVFDFDVKLDRHVLLPAAGFYAQVVPEPAREGVHNFLTNLNSPVIFANDVLQGETKRGAQTFGRFVINSTLGIGGLFDYASGHNINIPYHGEDFGQTLAVWGVGEGPYLVLPFVGPDPPRDAAGQVVDIFLDPTTYITFNYHLYWSMARGAFAVLDARARNASTLSSIERGSVDYYASVRSLYRQNRQNEINNGRTEIDNLPNF